MNKQKTVVGLRPKVFSPDVRLRAQQALERAVFSHACVKMVERLVTQNGVEFVVWSTEAIRLPEAVLGYPVRLKIAEGSPELFG
jgi:hypothetical protein